MPLNFHVGLPGPFAYNRRIGGRRGGSGGGGGGLVLGIVLALVVIMLVIKYWYVVLGLAALAGLGAWWHFSQLDPEDQAADETEDQAEG